MVCSFQAQLPFPEGGLVYDYVLDDGGLSQGDTGTGEEEADEDAKAEVVCLPSVANLV